MWQSNDESDNTYTYVLRRGNNTSNVTLHTSQSIACFYATLMVDITHIHECESLGAVRQNWALANIYNMYNMYALPLSVR